MLYLTIIRRDIMLSKHLTSLFVNSLACYESRRQMTVSSLVTGSLWFVPPISDQFPA